MTVIVEGRECPELAKEVRRMAERMRRNRKPRRPDHVSAEIGALALAGMGSDADYHAHFIRLLRYRDAVDTLDFAIPYRPGPTGGIMRRLKQILWKLLRYQHDRILFRQNLVNGLFTAALENEMTLRKREMDELRARIEALENGKKTH